MSPLEFMQRLAALVPSWCHGLHLLRFHGVLAPNAKLRAMVVPQGSDEAAKAAQPAECEPNCANRRPARMSWARLLKRVFEIDLEHCPNCGGELKIIAALSTTNQKESPWPRNSIRCSTPPVDAAHVVCPYSNATRGNIDVELAIV